MAAKSADSSAPLGRPAQKRYIAAVNAPPPGTGKLPVPRIVSEAFALPWLRRDAFFKGLAVPAAAIVAIQVAWWLAEERLTQAMGWAAWAANGILWILFAVICHRLVLLEPRPADLARIPGWGRRETFFLGWMVILSAIILAVLWGALLVIGTIVANLFSTALFESTYSYAGKIIGTYLFARLSLVLPATAIDARTSIPQAWRQTRGNGWRLVLIVGVLPWAYNYVASLVLGDEPGVAKLVLVTAAATVLLAVEISALSLSYRELTKPSPGEAHHP
jgi:hypothetical protein